MTIWGGQILSGLGLTVWSYSTNFLLADHTPRTWFKFLSCFEANQGGNGLDQAWSMRNVLIGHLGHDQITLQLSTSLLESWYPIILTHSPHQRHCLCHHHPLSCPQCVSLTSWSQLWMIMSWADWIGQCVMWHIEWPKTFIFVLNDLYSFNSLLHSLRMCADMTGMFITFALDLNLLH